MSEVYDDPNSLIGFPVVTDTTLEIRQLVAFFGLRAKNAQSGAGNCYIFSIKDNFCAVVHSRGDTYRLIGRCPDVKDVIPKKSTIDYDVYYSGTLAACAIRFYSLCLACLPSSLKTGLVL